MLDWLGYIGETIVHYFQMVGNLITMAFDSIALITSTFERGPMFLQPVMFCMLAVVVIMWVVNIF